jgi:PhnB protein
LQRRSGKCARGWRKLDPKEIEIMSAEKSYVFEGFHEVTPYIYGGVSLVDFMKRVFGAEITHAPEPDPSGQFHGEARIGDSRLMFGVGHFVDPSMKAAVWIYVPDVDATYRAALGAGASSVREPADQRWGDRVSGVKDSFGNTWWIATHLGVRD